MYIFINTRRAILMTTLCVFTSFWLITTYCSHLHVLILELIQNKSALNQRCLALKTQDIRAEKISAEPLWFRVHSLWNRAKFFNSEQRWFSQNQSLSALKQSWSALMFFIFSESALKNVKSLKQRCSALIISGTSTRDVIKPSEKFWYSI